MLIRDAPATELTVATRILARAGVLADAGVMVLRVGSEVVYLPASTVSASTMTPYDVCAVRLADGLVLSGEPRVETERYLEALRAAPAARAAALRRDGTILTAGSARECVAALLGRPYEELEAEARVTGALFGAYPIEPAGGEY